VAKFLTIFATATIFSGCCTVPPHVPFECPEQFEFASYSDELWLSLPEEAQLNINADDLNEGLHKIVRDSCGDSQ
jgi:hypothetical protein